MRKQELLDARDRLRRAKTIEGPLAAAQTAYQDAQMAGHLDSEALRAAVDAALATYHARLFGTDDEPTGILDRYEVNAIPAVRAGQHAIVTYYCARTHAGTNGRRGHVGVIARDLDGDQTGLTLAELAASAIEHEAEHHHGPGVALPLAMKTTDGPITTTSPTHIEPEDQGD